MKDPVDEFKKEIDKFLKAARMSPTVFSIRAANERTFYHRIKKGQEPGLRKVVKVRAFIKRHTARIERKKHTQWG